MRIDLPGVGSEAEPLSLTFDGRAIPAHDGDSIAAALIDADLRALRIAGPQDERGIFCGMGVCHECAVVVNGQPSRLACMTAIEMDMGVDKQPQAAALCAAGVSPMPEHRLEPDVLVIGGGPAGLSAATTVARSGLDVLIVDERSKLGGQYFKQPSGPNTITEHELDTQYTEGRQLIREASSAGVRTLLGVRVWGAVSPRHLLAAGSSDRYTIHPKSLVLGTGAYERGVPVPGWTLPGVMTTGAAQTLVRAYRVAPGRRVLISGNGPLNLQLAADLATAGVDVVALAEVADTRWWAGLGPGAGMALASPAIVARGMRYRAALARRRVPVLPRTALIAVHGSRGAESAVVAQLDASGRAIRGTEQTFEVDAVCVGFGFLPSNTMSRWLGCAHRYDEVSGALVVERTATGRTSLDGVWVIGDAGGVAGAQVAMSAGVLAGCDIVETHGRTIPNAGDQRSAAKQHRRNERFQKHLWRLYRAPILTDQLASDDTVVCRCESVTLASLRAAIDGGALTAGAVKRLTRAGMGKCQGRYCGPAVTAMAARRSGTSIDEYSGFAPQAPFGPTDVAAMAIAQPEQHHDD